MIEDFKTILDMIAKLPNFAIEVLLGFGIYKLIVYLSTTGSVVFVSRLLIEKIHDAITRVKIDIKSAQLNDVHLISGAEKHLEDILIDLSRNTKHNESLNSNLYGYTYLLPSDMMWLKQAVIEHVARVGYPGHEKK